MIRNVDLTIANHLLKNKVIYIFILFILILI